MGQNAYDAYLESRVLSADPLELVRLLCHACTASVREARTYLAAGDIASRCRCISKAYAILAELSASLDHERGGDLSRRLAELYDYMQRKLLESNFAQSDKPLSEVLGLMCTLSGGWEGISENPGASEQAGGSWSQPVPPDPEWSYASHGWSL